MPKKKTTLIVPKKNSELGMIVSLYYNKQYIHIVHRVNIIKTPNCSI